MCSDGNTILETFFINDCLHSILYIGLVGSLWSRDIISLFLRILLFLVLDSKTNNIWILCTRRPTQTINIWLSNINSIWISKMYLVYSNGYYGTNIWNHLRSMADFKFLLFRCDIRVGLKTLSRKIVWFLSIIIGLISFFITFCFWIKRFSGNTNKNIVTKWIYHIL